MIDSRTLIITGMHRSGTSLIASVLRDAGVDLGDELLGPAIGNPRGHFEDLDFLRLQESWLAAADLDLLVTDPQAVPRPDANQRQQAIGLTEQRAARPLWGFKDPRTTLYLDFWDELLPTARYLFVYRHPLEVALSLDRRGSDLAAVADPRTSLSSWMAYNRTLLDFARRHRQRCFLCDIEVAVADLPGFVRRLDEHLALGLEPADPALFHRDELERRVSSTAHRLLERLMPEVTSVLEELDTEADLAHGKRDSRDPDDTLTTGAEPGLVALERLLTPDLLSDQTRRPLLALLLGVLLEGHDDAVARAVKDHQVNLSSHRLHARNLEGVVREHEATLERTRQHLSYVESQFAQLEQAVEQSQAAMARLDGELAQREREIARLSGDLTQRDSELSQRDSELAHLADEIARRDSELAHLADEIARRDSELARFESQNARLEEATAHLERMTQETTQLRRQARTDQAQIAELIADRGALADHTVDLETQLAELAHEQGILTTHASQLEEASKSRADQSSRLRLELEESRIRLAELARHASNLEGLAEQRQQRCLELERHTANLENELARAQERVAELERHAANLEEARRWQANRIAELERHASNLEQLLRPTLGEAVLATPEAVATPPGEA